MSNTLIILLPLTLALLLTAKLTLRFIKDRNLCIEAKFLFINISNDIISKKNNNATGRKKIGRRVASAVLRHAKKFEITLHSITLPSPTIRDPSNLTQVIQHKIYISALIAYIESKVQRLIIEDDAFILSSDKDSFHFDISIKCRLYQLFPAITNICLELIKEKKVNKNVRK